jgi:hypothetical protein
MEDNRKAAVRQLRRSFECDRLEEELWAMAYGQIWPAVRRSLQSQPERTQRPEVASGKTRIARRA